MIRKIIFCLVLFVNIFMLNAQENASVQFDTTGLPQWAKDLRRAEIVAFGSFPFTMLFSLTTVGTYRYFGNNMDSRYAPLIPSPGAIPMNERELIITISTAVALSVGISIADFIIVQYKRNRKARNTRNLPEESTPIIIRKPIEENS